MNKTNFNVIGGYPHSLDDFIFQFEGIKEVVSGVCSAFGATVNGNFLISGAAVSGGDRLPGWIYLNGEVLYFPGQTLPSVGGGESLVWLLDLSYDPEGDKTLENTAFVSVYEIRRAKIVSALYDPLIHMYADGTEDTLDKKIISIIEQSGKYDSNVIAWQNYTPVLSANDGAANIPGGFVGDALGKWIYKNKTLSIKMQVTSVETLSTVKFLAFQLPMAVPVGYIAEGYSLCKYYDGATFTIKQVRCALVSTGAGTALEVSNLDESFFATASGGIIEFSITIGMRT